MYETSILIYQYNINNTIRKIHTMAKIQMSSIYVQLCRLRHHLKKMQFMMTKADRLVYGKPAIECCNEVLRDFVLAYEFQDERTYYYKKLVADFAVLRIELEDINHEGILRSMRKEELTSAQQMPKSTDKMYLRIFEIVGMIDEGIAKWRSTALRGKNVVD